MPTAGQLVQIIKGDQSATLGEDVRRRIDERYSAVDWVTLERSGFDKHGDYCFIYSYPPVRTLREIPTEDIFEPCQWEPMRSHLNVYLHIPYCSGICSYCYFAKVVDNRQAPISKDEYVELLIWEIDEKYRRYNPNAVIDTVHFGGGTPSILDEGQLRRILRYLHTLNLSPDAEITLECAPETIRDDRRKLDVMRQEGVNRINLGVENLDDNVLKLMGRRHTVADTFAAFANLRAAGFGNIATDLIYAVPGESLPAWVRTLQLVTELRPESISCYRLRPHPMKAISRHRQDIAGYEDGLRMQLAHGVLLGDAGYIRVSGQKYAASKSTINRQTELKRGVDTNQLLSAGCGAYGFLNGTFYWNTKSLREYGRRTRRHEHATWIGKRLDKDDLMRKCFVLGVHTSGGISRGDFRDHFDCDPLEVLSEPISEVVDLGLLTVDRDTFRPTENGYFFGDELSVKFYSPVVRHELDQLGMKYGMFWERDRYA